MGVLSPNGNNKEKKKNDLLKNFHSPTNNLTPREKDRKRLLAEKFRNSILKSKALYVLNLYRKKMRANRVRGGNKENLFSNQINKNLDAKNDTLKRIPKNTLIGLNGSFETFSNSKSAKKENSGILKQIKTNIRMIENNINDIEESAAFFLNKTGESMIADETRFFLDNSVATNLENHQQRKVFPDESFINEIFFHKPKGSSTESLNLSKNNRSNYEYLTLLSKYFYRLVKYRDHCRRGRFP